MEAVFELLEALDMAEAMTGFAAWPALKRTAAGMRRSMALPLHVAAGRARHLLPVRLRFTGAYPSYGAAMEAARRSALAGYDHEEVSEVGFREMCRIAPWDYPVLFWLRELLGEVDLLLDAGGHMGTKYRAFRPMLAMHDRLEWVVYDLPAIVNAGRRRAEVDGLSSIRFEERIEDAGSPDLFLGSGLLQYLDGELPHLLGRLSALPRHLLLNKVALRRGPTVVTLERIGRARVPYQIRNEARFLGDLSALGYRPVDRWSIPSLSHVIPTHPELGASESTGFYFRLAGRAAG